MNMWRNFEMALMSLKARKLRTLLTMLGIVMGVSSVILIVFIVQAASNELKSKITGNGKTMEVFYEVEDDNLGKKLEPPFTNIDINTVSNIYGVKNVIASKTKIDTLRYRDVQLEIPLVGINENYTAINNLEIKNGRFLSSIDFNSGNRVVIINSSVQEELLDGKSPIGEVIFIGKVPVEIVGVLKKSDGLLSMDFPEVYLPNKTMEGIYGEVQFDQLTIQTHSIDQLTQVGKSVEHILNRIHNTEDAYKVINIDEITNGIGQITNIMGIVIGSIAGISLLVGGVGVMNIMLVSVTERTREVGIRKSLGANRKQILFQFLSEAIIITTIGGIIGIVFGLSGAYIVAYFFSWKIIISWPIITIALLFSSVIGIFFGFVPADKASKLNPVDSLRYE